MSRAQVLPDMILLGVRDSDLDPRRHPPCFTVNKVGGLPAWLPGTGPPGTRPPGTGPRCRRCGALQLLVLQVYCPLDPPSPDSSPLHRNLHLFCCHRRFCNSSPEGWTILRSQGPGTPPEQNQNLQNQNLQNQNPQAALTATDWCDSADDWGEEEEQEEAAGGGGAAAPQDSEAEFSSRLQELRLGAAMEEVQEEVQEEEPPVLCPFFIAVVEESDMCAEDEELKHALQLLREYESREGGASAQGGGASTQGGGASTQGGGPNGEEKYEKSRARHGDAVFCRFMKRISSCPQQILRYCRGGEPLFITAPPTHHATLAPPCGTCGAARTLELQLMPALVSLLRWSSGAPAEVEFGTVMVYTCSRSCWRTAEHTALEEFCYIQTDPDQQLFN